MIVALALILTMALEQQPTQPSAELARRSRAGSEAMASGRFDDAVEIYGDLVRAIPNEPGLLMNFGMALAMAGREAEAIGPLERATAMKPSLLPAQLFLGSSYLAVGEPAKAVRPLQRAVAALPANIEYRRLLAQAYTRTGRALDAAAQLRKVTELDPALPAGWVALFHAYNAVAQDAIATFADQASERSERDKGPERGTEAPAHQPARGTLSLPERAAKSPAQDAWQDLLLADALLADGRFTDAFGTFQQASAALPAMVSIHDSIARIYRETGHPDWAAIEQAKGRLSPAQCLKRRPLCEFRAGRYQAALTAATAASDAESRYWRARAATELARHAFGRLDRLPDSRERREVRAALATAERRYADAVAELHAGLKLSPGDPMLTSQLGTALYLARDYEQAIAVLGPLVSRVPPLEDPKALTAYGDSLVQLDRVDEAVPILRRAFTADSSDREANLALARALMRQRQFGAALPLLEWQLADDADGSVHVLLSRALAGLGQSDKAEAMLAKSQELRRAAQQRTEDAGKRAITPPK